jgi:SWI/SNF-related matrix-associated actin-dependent regulator of chromatin subfamily D
MINCDELLKRVFNGQSQISFANAGELLNPHLLRPDPVSIEYQLQRHSSTSEATLLEDAEMEEGYILGRNAYDVEVEIEEKPSKLPGSLSLNYSLSKEIGDLNSQIADLISLLAKSTAKHQFYESFAADPVSFVANYVVSQSRDLECLMGEPSLHYMQLNQTDSFMKSAKVAESVYHYLQSKKMNLNS